MRCCNSISRRGAFVVARACVILSELQSYLRNSSRHIVYRRYIRAYLSFRQGGKIARACFPRNGILRSCRPPRQLLPSRVGRRSLERSVESLGREDPIVFLRSVRPSVAFLLCFFLPLPLPRARPAETKNAVSTTMKEEKVVADEKRNETPNARISRSNPFSIPRSITRRMFGN